MRGSTPCYCCALQDTGDSYELEGVVAVSAFTCQDVIQCRQHQSHLQGCLSGRKWDLFNCISYSHLKNPLSQLYKWNKEIAKGGKCWWCLLQSCKLHISHKFKDSSVPTTFYTLHTTRSILSHSHFNYTRWKSHLLPGFRNREIFSLLSRWHFLFKRLKQFSKSCQQLLFKRQSSKLTTSCIIITFSKLQWDYLCAENAVWTQMNRPLCLDHFSSLVFGTDTNPIWFPDSKQIRFLKEFRW